jgi:predicted nucleotidyltransferase
MAQSRGVRNIRVFGSVAKYKANAESDIDILVEMDDGRSLLDLAGFKGDMEVLLGHRVEVLTAAALHWFIRDQVLSEAVPL